MAVHVPVCRMLAFVAFLVVVYILVNLRIIGLKKTVDLGLSCASIQNLLNQRKGSLSVN